ncbi:MAG TPA: sialidase family protein [Candidatus Acidoferrum sp.]|nr:sialidase family protein [Candidatus Acidoferrum sp.]
MKARAVFWLRFPTVVMFVMIAGFLLARGQSPSVPPIRVVDLIPASLSGETNQDSEPFLAIQTANPQVMVVSAFTPNPFSSTGNAPVYVSQDGGKSWALNAITPVQRMTCDITHAMATGENHPRGDLHAGTLACASAIRLDESESNDVASSATMSVQSTRGNVDQPFVRALGVSSGDRIYVGVNDFNQPNGHTATVDVSVDGGATYKSISVEFRKTSGQNGPSVRPAVASDGTVYAAFFGWRKFNGTVATSDIVVVRDDAAAIGANPFQALKDPSDKLPGRVVVKNASIPWSNAPTLGQERIGSTLSIAVDPNNSSTVYVSWADRGKKGDIYTLHVRRSTDRGVTWSKTDLPHTTISNATNIALAVANNGVAGFLYQQLSNGRWVTHLLQSDDAFTTIQDTILASVPANEPVEQFLPYLGDYDYLLSVGNEFRGVFCANNMPDLGNFPNGVTYQRAADFTSKMLNDGSGNPVAISIDPFYFSVPVIP